MSPVIPLLLLLLLLLPLLALTVLIGRIWRPWARPPGGLIVRHVTISLLGKLRMQAPLAVPLLVLTGAGWLTGGLPLWLAALTTVAVAVVVAAPFRYTMTTEGLAIGRSRVRRWTEFGGVSRRHGGVRLQGIAGSRGQTVWLSGNRDDDEFVRLLRQLVRGAYKGHVGPATTELPAHAEITPLRPFEQAPAVPS